MPILVLEKWTSGKIEVSNNPYAEFEYLVKGTDNAAAALAAVGAEIPQDVGGAALQSAGISGRIAEDIWGAYARYGIGTRGEEERRQPGDVTYSFDASAGNAHITNSLETVGRYAAFARGAPDLQGAINVTEDAVEGVDIYVPQLQLEYKGWFSPSVVTFEYVAQLMRMTATTNNAPFKGFAAGELLFLGPSGSRKNAEQWELTFRFAASPNKTDLQVGSITGISKKGWEYLWIRYEDRLSPETSSSESDIKTLLKAPVYVYVERVYDASNFALFGLGV